MLEFITRELQFKLNGEVVKIAYPSAKQLAVYSNEYDDAEDKFESIFVFLEVLNLSREISEKMELNHLMQIIKALTEEKK
tara:strand:- start:2676 stop:2915 length:240 start_codon:yes stop_codon:yes gene_type:complete